MLKGKATKKVASAQRKPAKKITKTVKTKTVTTTTTTTISAPRKRTSASASGATSRADALLKAAASWVHPVGVPPWLP